VTLLGPTARVEGGVIVGSTVSFPKPAVKVNQFLGVPFANPAQRFSPPNTPVRSWVGRWDATKTRASCMQQFNGKLGPAREFTTSVFNVPAPVESEDCLYLNIFTPREQPRAGGRPVLFWIYGGSLQFGNAGMPGYNGSYLAGFSHQVITANYRTNLFGFPTSPAIPIRERNLGFLDQRAALEWVRNNIEEFGGNPSKVTIFGESAGAASVDALLTSYSKTSLSRPNFRAAILQSGQIGIRRASAQATPFSSWDKLAAEAKCSGTSVAVLACLRKAPAIALKAIIESNSLSFTPTVDNYTLVSAAERKRATGQLQTFPVMVGSNAEEGRVFQINQNNLTDYLQKTFPNDQALQQQVRAAYPKGQNGLDSDYDIASAIMTDLQFGCTAAILAADNVRGVYPTWRFFFNATFPNLQKFPNAGAYHASEIELIFGTYGTLPTAVSARASTTEEVALSAAMQKAWAQFAKNPAAGPGWTK
ncbi:alpha/beta-hydrolase, partial [Tothia fuscella]